MNPHDPKHPEEIVDAYKAWCDGAMETVRRFASSREPFTTDELWRVLSAPPEPRALGGVISKAVRGKLIRPTGRWILSTREVCNSRPVREWVGV